MTVPAAEWRGAAVTAVGLWTAAGGLEDTLTAVQMDQDHTDRAAPYPTNGLRVERGGFAPGLDRMRPAASLCERAIADAALGSCPDDGVVGLVLATASGAMPDGYLSEVVAESDVPGRVQRHGLLPLLVERLGVTGPAMVVSVACASGVAAFEPALGWLRSGRCDVVYVVGVDALDPFVHTGFDALGVLCPVRSTPHGAGAAGVRLGEAAAVVRMVASSRAQRPVLGHVLGVGIAMDPSSGAAPSREGHGFTSALRRALRAAAVSVDMLDGMVLHGTGTAANDAAERAGLFDGAEGAVLPARCMKPVLGHTLGAAGVVEVAVELVAAARGLALPGVDVGSGETVAAGVPQGGAVLAAAFGGCHAALVWGRSAVRSVGGTRIVQVGDTSETALDTPAPDGPQQAVRSALSALPPLPPRAAVVLTGSSTCARADRRHGQRVAAGVGRRVSRRTFLRTMPGAPLFEVLPSFGVTGPVLTVVGGPEDGRMLIERWLAEDRAAVGVHLHLIDRGGQVSVQATRFEARPA